MKKIMMSAAVLAILATSCQNEVLVEQSQPQEGQLLTLEVGRGIESRTVLGDEKNGEIPTWWSTDDAIYVSGKAGSVHGVLKFAGYVNGNKSKAKFSGFIFNGYKNDLEYIVFPVPEGGKTIDMSKRAEDKLDAPMIGTLENGVVKTFNNVGGLLAFKVNGGEGNVYGVTATSTEGNMTGGYYEFDAEDGTLKYNPMPNNVAQAKVMENDYVYIPVATTTDETNGDDTDESFVKVKVEVINLNNNNVIKDQDNIQVDKGDVSDDTEDLTFDTVSDDKVDINWYDSSKTEFEISTAKQLAGLAKIVNENIDLFAEKTIKLADNVDLKDIEWLPIGTSDYKFAGTFDGNEKKISNMTIEAEYAAFMAYTDENVTIKNITFENVNINSTKHAAGVVCVAGTGLILENIKVSGKIIATSYAGGIVHNATNISIDGCENNASVSANRAGGIASWVTSGATINEVKNTGKITGAVGASGIAHGFGGSIRNAINQGEIQSTGIEVASGIAGVQKTASTYEYCFNYGNVTSTADNPNSSAAGILGQTPGTKATINYCVNYGVIKAEASYAAGIGYDMYGSLMTANYCYNAGNITGADGAGAIAPKPQYGKNTIANFCLNAGTITSSNGKVYQASDKINSCYYYEGAILKNVDGNEISAEEALVILNGGKDTEFFGLDNGKIFVNK